MLQKKFSAQPHFVAGETLSNEHPQTRAALIMVAEDDDDNRLMLKTLLEMRGYRVLEVRDGQEAITAAREEAPDLILMDLQLPRLNGIAVARYMRLDEELRDMPIIIVSGHDPARHRQLALAAGCNAYLHKPIDFDHLEELLRSFLGSTQSSPTETTANAVHA